MSQNYAATRHPFYTADPPNWERIRVALATGSNRQNICLWELVEHPLHIPVAMALYHKHQGEFSCLVHPHYREIEDAIYDWVEREHLTTKTKAGKKLLKCSVCESNEIQKALLARRGYSKAKMGPVFRKCFLDGGISEIALLKGYAIREIQTLSEESFAERAIVENEVFDRTITVAFLRQLQDAPIYRPELDLVITAPSGSIAAFCTIWFDGEHRVGFYEPVGTVLAHRRCGLGKVLMIEGFRRLQEMGATTAYLGNSADNSAGNRLYESVGMTIFDQEYWWQKEF